MTRTRSWLAVGGLALACAFPLAVRADDAKPASEAPAARQGEGAANALKDARAKVDELNLSSDQKTKVDEVFTNAEADLKRTFADAANMQPDERRQKFTEFMSGLKEKVAAVLTDDQKTKFEQVQLAASPGAGSRGAAGAGAGRGQAGDRLKQALEKLDLTAEQKEKVKPIMEEFKKKFEAMRSEGQGGDKEKVREKATEAMKELRTKLMEVLTPEQQQKFRESFAGQAGAGRRQQQGKKGAESRSSSDSKSSDTNK